MVKIYPVQADTKGNINVAAICSLDINSILIKLIFDLITLFYVGTVQWLKLIKTNLSSQ